MQWSEVLGTMIRLACFTISVTSPARMFAAFIAFRG